ncbi:hypothetical protein NEIRO02_0802 [Nematocida sp. AWRm79]|nr:hypothetical protein NEIRO02_0802 [Nematocida sp. AWRm79]
MCIVCLMVWCSETGKYLSFKKERVCSFFTRNNIGISTHVILKIEIKDGSYSSEEILHLNSELEPESNCKYILTKPEYSLKIYINAYARMFLKTEKNKVVFPVSSELPVSHVLSSLENYFPIFPYFDGFALYRHLKLENSTSLQKVEMHKKAAEVGPVMHLQPSNPFGMSRQFPSAFSNEFYQLKNLNSTTVFAKKYIVSIYGHFLFACKKGTDGSLGYTLEITEDLIAYPQIVGSKVFAIIEQNGTKWSLFNKDADAVRTLLYYIERAPRYLPRETEAIAETAESWEKKCDNVRDIVTYNISSSSLPTASVLFPRSIPKLKDEINKEQSAEFLIRKLESHVQRSIWDNVNIEFLVYLLSMQGISLASEIHEEIREYSLHRKRILRKIKEIEDSL